MAALRGGQLTKRPTGGMSALRGGQLTKRPAEGMAALRGGQLTKRPAEGMAALRGGQLTKRPAGGMAASLGRFFLCHTHRVPHFVSLHWVGMQAIAGYLTSFSLELSLGGQLTKRPAGGMAASRGGQPPMASRIPRRKPAWTPALPVPSPPGGWLPTLLMRRLQLAVHGPVVWQSL